jgi:hypothetical protein
MTTDRSTREYHDDQPYLNDSFDENGSDGVILLRRRPVTNRVTNPSTDASASASTTSTGFIELRELGAITPSTTPTITTTTTSTTTSWTNLDEPRAVIVNTAHPAWPCIGSEQYTPIAGRSPEVRVACGRRVGVVCTFQDMPGR